MEYLVNITVVSAYGSHNCNWIYLYKILYYPNIKQLRITCLNNQYTWHMVTRSIYDMVFYNTSPPRMFLSLDLLWEYRIQHGANGPLYVTSSYSTWIFCRGVPGFGTDCPCGVWCRGLTTCLLHVSPPFGNRILNNSWAVGLTLWIMNRICLCFDICNYICHDTSDHFSVLPS